MSYITPKDKPRFKAAYTKALSRDLKVFKFKGIEYLVSYAKYVIDYLEGMNDAKA